LQYKLVCIIYAIPRPVKGEKLIFGQEFGQNEKGEASDNG